MPPTASAAYAAADAANAANAAAYAAYAAYYAASGAICIATYYGTSAYAAAYYAAYAANAAVEEKKLNEYKNYLISMINDLSELERVLWGLEGT
jgi:hypothetical protein